MNLREWALERERKYQEAVSVARANPGKPVKLEVGLYLFVTKDGLLREVEHVTKIKGFIRNEWTISTWFSNQKVDCHHDQYPTKKEAFDSLK